MKVKFSNYVSLGYICPVAASMSKYGLRSWSGPFDWLITKDLKAVLHSIENEFEDFLIKENLEHFQKKDFKYFIAKRNLKNFKENPKHFIDRNGDFVFLHEKFSYDTEFEKIYACYLRKNKKFLSEITKPTCFLRTVSGENEITYIKENSAYINEVIKKGNKHSEIVFLINSDIKNITSLENFPYRYWIIDERTDVRGRRLRDWFDGANDFLEFCASNFDAVTMMRNIMFEQNKETLQYQQHYIIKQRYDILLKILGMDLQNIFLPQKAIIYGAGNVGRQFYLRIKDECEVVAFCDKVVNGTRINNLPVLDLKEIEYERKVPFIVTATYDFESICNEIKQYDKDAIVISLEEILK